MMLNDEEEGESFGISEARVSEREKGEVYALISSPKLRLLLIQNLFLLSYFPNSII